VIDKTIFNRVVMAKHIESSGFTPPASRSLGTERRTAALAQLVAGAALALSTIVAVTAVSVGIARASVVDGVVGNEGSLFGVALLLGLIFVGMGGLSLTLPGHWTKKH
jgi:hypothetical protein